MKRFFADIDSFLFGWLSGRSATPSGESATPAEPAPGPSPETDPTETASRPETGDAFEAAGGSSSGAVSDSPDLSSSVASPSMPSSVATGAPGRGKRRVRAAADRLCPWCSAAVRASDAVCPNCGATLDGAAADGLAIPGLTEVPPALRRYAENAKSGRKRQSLLKMILSDEPIPPAIDAPPPSDEDALRPPSAALRAEMARLDLEIAAGRAPRPDDDAGTAAPPDSAPPPSAPEPAGGEQRT